MKVITVLGARPQFIKAAMVSRALEGKINEILLHTGQHYDSTMSDIFFSELSLPKPKYHLGVGSSSHAKQTGQMLEGIENVLLTESPDYVVVYGDTNSTLAGALAASKLCIPVVHIEAGLRSFNRNMPEEINRVLTDHLSEVLLVPTREAHKNLKREGIEKGVFITGDVMYDAALHYKGKAEANSNILQQLQLQGSPYMLATIHRAENTDSLSRLQCIVEAFCKLSQTYTVVWPLHPRTKKQLIHYQLLPQLSERVMLIEPVGMLDMIKLESHAAIIITDSGGVQKEAFFYRVPCITLREETEWLELVQSGWNTLVTPVVAQEIVCQVNSVLAKKIPEAESFYGNGCAAELIAEILFNYAN